MKSLQTFRRRHIRRGALWVGTLALTLCLATEGPTSAAEGGFPNPLGYVSDYAEVLDGKWTERIRSVCQDLERKTGVEMVVVTRRTIEPYANVREYAGALYKYWKIGTVQQEHGVLVLAFIEKPQAAVTLGRNMIRVISPALLQDIRRDYIDPKFKVGGYGEGLYRTVVALASASQDIRVGTPSRAHSGEVAFWLTVFMIVTVLSFFWWVTRPEKRHPFPRIQRGEFWGTGQGGFGGNLGGFGGGD